MNRTIRLIVLALLACFTLATSARASNLGTQLQNLINAANIGNTRVAFMVVDLNTGDTLAQQNADQPMIPASNAKLITTAAAFNILGPKFVYHTRLKELPPAAGSSLPRLVVVGDGDPSFGDPVLLKKFGYVVDDLLNQWTHAVAKTGIKHFSTLLVDDRVFDHQFIYPDWPKHQLIRDYCAQVAGIDFYLNCLSITPIPGAHPGDPATIRVFPPAPFIPTTNDTVTKAHGYFAMDRDLGTNHLIFTGSVSHQPDQPYLITVNDPPMTFGRIFASQLKQQGITVDQVKRPGQQTQLPKGEELAVATSTLPVVIARCVQDSQNMYAESLFKRIGYAVTGQPGSWSNGAAAVRIFLRKRLGPNASLIRIVDGSGMSRDNRVTARLIVKLLISMHQEPNIGKIYMHCLAHAGVNGTLKYRLKNLTGAQVYGKTGTLDGVSTLSGYILFTPPPTATQIAANDPPKTQTTPHHAIVFSLLFNGFKPPLYAYDMRKLQDQMVRLIIKDEKDGTRNR